MKHMIKSLVGLALCLGTVTACAAVEIWVSPDGDDANPGTRERPLATLAHARDVVRAHPDRGRKPITVILRGGVYRLRETLVFTAADSGSAQAPVIWRGAEGETAVISGGVELQGLQWRPYRNGIYQAKVPAGFTTDQLFVNGQLMPMARYPNYDPTQRIFNGTASDAISPERVARWKDPAGGFLHALHRNRWGSLHYRILGKDAEGNLLYEGGWQNNRPAPPHKRYRFVENIFEELDAPGEWFLDKKSGTLYFYPPRGVDLSNATIEGVRLRHLIEFRGSADRPVHHIRLENLTFRHAARTFMDTREPILRSDWAIYRGGAVLLEGTEDCAIVNSTFEYLGGNAIFVSKYNRRVTIRGCHIHEIGANAIAFVGDPAAVRNALVGFNVRLSLAELDLTPGPKTSNYPADCLVEDCLVHDIGRIEKQVAGVEIDMAMDITVRHCTIYNTPRAGINIGDGCWGGHVIEFCDVFNTVLETGDHGSFNSWGRDRFWGLKDIDLNTITLGKYKNLPKLDHIKPNILRYNRWRCDYGWDIDLDDGSSNYLIYNNLCLRGGIKLREGFYRVVENNIMVNNSFHPHVWYRHSEDVFRRNIVFRRYRPIRVPKPWGKEIDYNLLHEPGRMKPRPATELQAQSGRDEHSLVADARFVDPAHGDYRVKEGSPALALGFKNFPMDQFGVVSPRLRRLARTPKLPVIGEVTEEKSKRDPRVITWLGAKIKNIIGLGEVSAAGLPGEIGVSLVEVPPNSAAAKAGLRVGDVILKCNGRPTDSVADLIRLWRQASSKVTLEVWRNQRAVKVTVSKP